MIYIGITIIVFFIIFLLLNIFYVTVVRYHDQEEYIKRGSCSSKKIDVAAFGSSYCRYAFNFDKTNKRGYNFGIVAQFLYYTDLMIRSFRKCYSDKAVILIVLPDLVFAEPGKGKYGASRYVRFIDKTLLGDEYSLKNKILLSYFPLFIPDKHNFKVCIKRILSYSASKNEYYTLRHNYISKKENIVAAEKRCKDWCDEFHLENTISADIPFALYDKFEQSTTILTKIIDYCLGENLRPILVVTPLSSIMREKISQPFLDKVLYSNIKRANIQGIPVLDYLNDERFSDIDLYANNADFLNAQGRELFTNIVLDDIKNMIDKSIYNISRKKCSGCKMCADICPKKAISFEYTRGFWYPLVDDNKCINCGLCRKKCPSLNEAPDTLLEPVACYGAKSKNEQIRESSTSGGFFSELAINWMLNGGYCIAALYNEDNKIIHHVSNNIADIDLFRQSKYAQSDTQGIYKKARHLLQDGKKVLFCGTACQVEALKAFLGKEYENLVTMDFVCLGIGSPFVYRKYLNMLEKKYRSKIVRVWFKNKSLGWRTISTKVDFENGKSYLEPGYGDLFMMAFVSDALSIRPNCEFCKFRKIPHNSDFTVADFWGIEKINPSFDDNKGLSAIFVNSRKGYDIFSSISSNLDYFETSANEICQGNFSTLSPMSPNPNSELFMDYLQTHSLQEAMHKYGSYKGLKKIRIFYRRYRRLLSEIFKI